MGGTLPPSCRCQARKSAPSLSNSPSASARALTPNASPHGQVNGVDIAVVKLSGESGLRNTCDAKTAVFVLGLRAEMDSERRSEEEGVAVPMAAPLTAESRNKDVLIPLRNVAPLIVGKGGSSWDTSAARGWRAWYIITTMLFAAPNSNSYLLADDATASRNKRYDMPAVSSTDCS